MVKTYTYDAFGNIESTSGSLSQVYTYTGREFDSESGLYFYRARYYDPSIGRFLQEDPVWAKNLYSYVDNNPINYVDPEGLQAIPAGMFSGSGPVLGNGFAGGIEDISFIRVKEDLPQNIKRKIKGAVSSRESSCGNELGVGGFSYFNKGDKVDPKPPKGLFENPNRKGSWGVFDKFGKFIEKWRFDKGTPGKAGWGGKDHLHFNGERFHYPPNAPYLGGK